ncbi:MAG: hypothetical protein LKI42_05560 [Bacteroidales bacterium]|nr:hypothetical protein [Bacteroidales bacterium]MCI1785906.1 hypothetical protein [Bacteroidales bacterium]
MKKNLLISIKAVIMTAALITTVFITSGCSKDDDKVDGPSIEWAANPNFSTEELAAQGMSVDLTIKAPAGIEGIVISVQSPAASFIATLNAMISIEENKDATSPKLDLINDATVSSTLTALGIQSGTAVQGKTELELNLSSLVPMILYFSPAANTDHIFTATITDKNGNTYSKAVKFHYSGSETN